MCFVINNSVSMMREIAWLLDRSEVTVMLLVLSLVFDKAKLVKLELEYFLVLLTEEKMDH